MFFELCEKGVSRGLTGSILEVEKGQNGGKWVKIPLFDAEEGWNELSGGTKLGMIAPWEDKGHTENWKGKEGGNLLTYQAKCPQIFKACTSPIPTQSCKISRNVKQVVSPASESP